MVSIVDPMKYDQGQLITAKHPDLFDLSDGPRESSMAFGFQLNGPGWLGLLDGLCATLQRLAGDIRGRGGEFKILQVKQKLGALRIYYRGGDDQIEAEIDRAIGQARHICEICGRSGELHSDSGYLIIRCADCH